MMVRYLEESPYGKAHRLTGLDGLLGYLEKRKVLEHRTMERVFGENVAALKAKGYEINNVAELLQA